MTRISLFARLLPFCAFAALVACGGPGPEAEPTGDGGACQGGVCVLSGTILEDMTLTADKAWLLRGGVFVGDDVDPVTLTIEPGTTVYGESATTGMLVVRRNARLVADGTADAPIVFTSSKEEGARARGDWGGLILNGNAPVNGCDEGPCETFGEGGTGYYGGDDPDDDSGVLRYVRVEFAGNLLSPDNELNGVAFQGVGRGTTVDHLQVHMAKDDCVEFFGGTAEAKHVLCTGIADDNLDWTDGWQGKLQYFVAQQYEDAGDNGIEADNNGENNAAAPRSHPMLSHLTLIGSAESDRSDIGILLREGTAANLANVVVTGFGEACVDVDHAETFAHAGGDDGTPTGELTIENAIIDCATPFALHNQDFDGDDVEDADPFDIEVFFSGMSDNQMVDPALTAPTVEGAGRDFRPADDSPARTGAMTFQDDSGFFDEVDFRGAVDPDDDWTVGWTTAERD